ncbi:MAG TPA: ribose-5-phosphate isomerase A, partial [Steroidobacteraceae bacterium]|nr:ribose-5-phosphate isomerase A [Steroidobacteraceae bacterium]
MAGAIMAADANANKRRAALAALEMARECVTLGVGTGSTVNLFIEALAASPGRVRRAVSSSQASSARLAAGGIETVDLNTVTELPLYVDGADEATRRRHLIKGGGGALTGEKIVAEAAREFLCIIDDAKLVETL